MITALIFIVLIGILIFVHELGHFLTARRNGIKADEFGFGFPPRAIGFWKDEETGRWKTVRGNADVFSKNTVYSLNWLPLGGFVKIKGENGEGQNEPDSFASKGSWPRVKVLAAGVIMNFLLAWLLISAALFIGAPEAIDADAKASQDAKIQISEIVPDSPASGMGLKVGDEILKTQADGQVVIASVSELQDYINSKKGQTINLEIKRGMEILKISGTPRPDAPEGQGPLGIGLTQTVIVSYPWYESLWKGAVTTVNIMVAMLVALFGIITSLVTGQGVGAEISGPVGIAVMTKQVATLGLVYLLQFAAILSINLGIINAFPFPALDGGRILFIMIEKLKGSPVSQKTEHIFHTAGFILLILLMVLITFRDAANLLK